jgi:tRNA(Ile)-lysidine synthase
MALLCGSAGLAPETGWILAVAHVHHGWRGREADRDLAFVAAYARRLKLPFTFRRCDARAAARQLALSPEAAARYVRYLALAEMARETGSQRVATAHQRDDRIESLLLARERKGGLARLAGPRPARADGVVRPLLGVSRAEILEFLEHRGVPFRRDASNGDLRLDRNRVRREVLARLRTECGEAAVEALAREADGYAAERERVEREFEERVRPTLRPVPGGLRADASRIAACALEIQRKAVEEMTMPFARPGRPPLTGREREQILRLLATGRDFRFEAGRRIRLARRGRWFEARPRPETSRFPALQEVR